MSGDAVLPRELIVCLYVFVFFFKDVFILQREGVRTIGEGQRETDQTGPLLSVGRDHDLSQSQESSS